jgi:hypothetical protein
MCHRHRHLPLLSILGRIGWARDPDSWSTECRDGQGRLATVAVRLGYGFVTLECPPFGLVYLTPVQVGRLRAALRSAGFDLALFGGPGLPVRPGPVESPDTASIPIQARRTVVLRGQTRPTVAEIAARLMVMADVANADEPVAVYGNSSKT